jgi:hypothetical protein
MLIAFAVIGLILQSAAVVLGGLSVRHFRRAARLGIPVQNIVELAPGFGKVRGRLAALGKPLRSPLTDQACVYYRLRVAREHRKWATPLMPEAETSRLLARVDDPFRRVGNFINSLLGDKRSTKMHPSWVPVLDPTQSVRVALEDATGKVELDLQGVKVVIKEPDPNALRARPEFRKPLQGLSRYQNP